MSRKSFLVRYYYPLKILAISLLISFFILIISSIFLQFSKTIVVLAALFPFLGWKFYHVASAAEVFSEVIAAFDGCITIDWLRFIISIDEKFIRYHFLFSPYSLWMLLRYSIPREEVPPEHFQIWRGTSWSTKTEVSPYDPRKYLLSKSRLQFLFSGLLTSKQQPDFVSKEIVPFYPEDAPEIPSLRYIGIARIEGNVLLALLSGAAKIKEFKLIFNILDQIEGNIQKDLSKNPMRYPHSAVKHVGNLQ